MFINTWETRQLSEVDKKGCKRQAHKKVDNAVPRKVSVQWEGLSNNNNLGIYVGPFLTNFRILSCEYKHNIS